MDAVRAHFRPEFLNRLDDIVLFSPLSRDNLHSIISLQIQRVAHRLQEKDIALKVDEKAMDLILKVAYDPIYGARPLRRYLEKHIVTALSKLIISGSLLDHSVVHISAKGDKLDFLIEQQPEDQKKKNARR